MSKQPIITDIDDCALDWTGGFKADMQPLLGRAIASGPSSWDMSEWLGVPNPLEHVVRFNTSPAFGRLVAFACAKAVLTAAAAAGHPVFAITACAEDVASHRLRHHNLDADFGPIFAAVHFVPLGGNKAPHLRAIAEQHGPGVWVEDNHKNAIAGADAGHTPFVIRRTHNRDQEAACTDARLRWIDDYYPVGAHLGLNSTFVPDRS